MKARSALVSEAEKIANECVVIHPATQDGGVSVLKWTRLFAAEVETRAAPLLKNGATNQADG